MLYSPFHTSTPPLPYPYIPLGFISSYTGTHLFPEAFPHLLQFPTLLLLSISAPSAYLCSHSLSSAEVVSNLKGRAICTPLVIGWKGGGEVGGGCFTED